MKTRDDALHLRNGGVSLVLAPDRFGLPAVIHWGAELDDRDLTGLIASAAPAVMFSSFDAPRSFPLIADRSSGWSGTPAIELSAGGRILTTWEQLPPQLGPDAAHLRLRDADGLVEVRFALALDTSGVLRIRGSVANTGDETVDVHALRTLLPVPARASEVLDFSGRWSGERRPQRAPLRDGTWSRQTRRGRPGHDAPLLTMAGTPGFGFRSGELWAAHVAWSGDQEVLVERLSEGAGVHGAVLGGGELLQPGEVRLAPGESYTAPELVLVWSAEGIDGATARLHRSLRARPGHPQSPRPLLLNTWEAVYFDHDFARLTRLADAAAEVGVERFVLDDGWFRGRRDNTAGLGDWFVDEDLWPDGLLPLSRYVHERGMQFGLWFEPEMVNPDSELARTHPDWLLRERPELTWRHQFVLDFSRPEVAAYVLERLDAVITAAEVDYVKWDHNRDLHASLGADGSARVHSHTLAVYGLLDELRRRHPSLEIESCASGGARVDLGILERTDRVWASDTNDPIERQGIQRWTQTLLPPELIGSHLGPGAAHTTHRHASLSFRMATALFGHAGIEWDLTRSDADEREQVRRFTALYRELRPLLHGGVTVRGDLDDDGALLHGVVSEAGDHAVFAWVRTATGPTGNTVRVPLPGLRRDLSYRVRVRTELGEASRHELVDPAWMSDADVTFTGAVLAEGLPLPLLNPGQALLLELTAEAAA